MANICSNCLEVSGDAGSIKTLLQLIKSQEKEFVDQFFFLEKGQYYGIVDDSLETQPPYDYINLSTTTKWGPPLEALEALSAKFPDLTFKIDWEEPSCEVFGEATYNNGKGEVTDKTALEYYIDANDDMGLEYNRIHNSSPEDLLKELLENELEGMTADDYPMNLLQPMIVAKIKHEDLPLIINMEWNEEATRLISERMSHGTDNREPQGAGSPNQNIAA